MLLTLENIFFTHHHAKRPLFTGASLAVSCNDKIGLCGDNGSGKSTLFHIITGLLDIQKGSIHFHGKTLATAQDFQQARLAIGYLLQHAADQLFCSSVLEDVAFGPLNQNKSQEEAKRIAKETLQRLSIEHLAHCAGCNLSGGEQKLAALATILAMHPQLLLLDEPTNDLDQQSQAHLERLLSSLSIPYIIVSHDQDFLAKTCTRFLSVKDGIILPHSAS